MKTKIKKTAVVLMSLIMVMCYMPMMAFADSQPETTITVTAPDKIGTSAAVATDENGKVTGSFNTADFDSIDVVLKNTDTEKNGKYRVIVEGTDVQLVAKDSSNNWYNITKSGWGPAEGFEITAQAYAEGVTTTVYPIAEKQGTYKATIKLVDVSNNAVVASTEATINAANLVKTDAGLKNAIANAEPGDTITLAENITANETITIDKALKLDLNGKNLTFTNGKNLEVTGDATVLDSTAVSAPQVADDNSITYSAGKIEGTKTVILVKSGGTLSVKSGIIKSTGNVGVAVEGETTFTDWSTKVNSSATIEGGYLEGPEGALIALGNGAKATVKDGVLLATDNAAVAGNGSCNQERNLNYGGTEININGGTLIGKIKTAGYIACGIYHPQYGTLNVTGGKIIAVDGVGIVVRNGELNLQNADIKASGTTKGWVGDKRIDLDSSGVIFEYADGYNHNNEIGDSRKASISGGTISADAGVPAVQVLTEGTKNIEKFISGGTYTSKPDEKYLVSGYVVKDNGNNTFTVGSTSVPPTPAPDDNVTNNPGDKTTTADVETSTGADGKAVATVDKTTADKIVEKAIENKSEQVIIDATTKGDAKTVEVSLPAETIKALVEKTDADVVIKTDAAEVVLDQKAAAAVADQAKTGNVMIVVDKVKEDDSQVHFELKVVTDNGNVTDFKGGSVKVTVALPAALKDKEVVCVYIDEKGSYTKVSGVKNADGTYTFTTGHFSTYAVMTAEEADKVIKEQEKAKNDRLKAGVKATTLKASSTAKKGSISIKWKKSYGYKVDYFQVFRSTKKDSGYGTKAFYTTKSGTQTTYKNTKQVKKGTRYYYKVRGVRTIDGVKVYTKWSSKAIRTAK